MFHVNSLSKGIVDLNSRKIISGKKIPLRILMSMFSKCILLAVGNQENYNWFFLSFAGRLSLAILPHY